MHFMAKCNMADEEKLQHDHLKQIFHWNSFWQFLNYLICNQQLLKEPQKWFSKAENC